MFNGGEWIKEYVLEIEREIIAGLAQAAPGAQIFKLAKSILSGSLSYSLSMEVLINYFRGSGSLLAFIRES